MSEKIYRCLLRLYPRHFRETYGDDALQVVRDRSRAEQGPFQKVRLWMDLLRDLAVSIPRERRRAPVPLPYTLAKGRGRETPGFYSCRNNAPRFGSLILAGALSVLTFALIPLSIGSGSSRELTGELLRGELLNSPAAEHRRIVDLVIRNIQEHYFDGEIGRKMAAALLEHQTRGDYAAVSGGNAFAYRLTQDLRRVSHDMHLEVVYSDDLIPNLPPIPTPAMLRQFRRELERANCNIERSAIVDRNVGYLKLNGFPDLSICQGRITASMASLNRVNAIIFDLRDNRGGDRETVSLVASYLFDHPEFLYDPRFNPTAQSWIQPRPGSKLTNKPVFILTSHATVSAAEQFTYNLKMLKRATVVGETTHGSAHAGVFYRLDDHFGMGIPKLRPMNPYSPEDWEGRGVAPDVKVDAANAVEAAKKLIASRLQ